MVMLAIRPVNVRLSLLLFNLLISVQISEASLVIFVLVVVSSESWTTEPSWSAEASRSAHSSRSAEA